MTQTAELLIVEDNPALKFDEKTRPIPVAMLTSSLGDYWLRLNLPHR
jgi:hypothetical protein